MWDFLQTYGIWIVFGVLFILMMRMHSGRMHGNGMGDGCGMGMGHGQSDEPSNTQRAVPLDDTDVDTRDETFVRDVPPEEEEIPSSQYRDPVGHHTGR